MKKALSLILSILMVFTVFAAALPTAFAEGEELPQMKYVNSTEAYNPYKTAITEISFTDTLTGAPAEGYVWDVSDKGDGSVKAWLTDVVESGEGEDKTVTSAKLVIGAEGALRLPVDSGSLFEGFSEATSIDFGENVDTTDVVNMEKMFDGCTALKSVDISAFESDKVQSFVEMFENCSSLAALDLGALEIDSAVSIARMMKGCKALESVRIDNWYFGKQLTDMSSLFEDCEKLTDIYIYDVSYHGDSKPTQHNVYYGVNTSELKFHDNRNIGTDAELWERYFDDAKGATLVFDLPENYTVVLNPGTLSLLEGQSVTVTATVYPKPDNSEITWESNDNSVATVKNGVVTAIGKGETTIKVTNKTVDAQGPKISEPVYLTVKVDKPKSEDCYRITFDKPDTIEYFLVSKDNGETYIPVHGGTFEHLKGTTLTIKAYGAALSYVFSVNGKDIDSADSNRLILEVNRDKTVSVRPVDFPSGEETLSFFERVIKWFRDLFDKLFGWMN